jgi:Uma2 family endonuclease
MENDQFFTKVYYIYSMLLANKYRPHYTYEDYCQWEGNWELIDGIPYAMSPLPVPQHQRVSMLLSFQFEESIKKSGCKNCKTYIPLDWKIAEDTIVQPDVLIVCNKIEKRFLDFPPVLVVEVLSPSTASKDRGEKMELYKSQAVKYYLIIDPQFNKIEVYELIENNYKLISTNPISHHFNINDDCAIEVFFKDIWD